VNWTVRRLGTTEVSIRDGYWFAYISTTTIGLGDFILTPGVLRAIDMVSWPFNFLVGFVFFSAFVGKLSQIVMKPMQDNADHLARRLRERGMIYGDARNSSNQIDVVQANTSEDAEQRSVPSTNSEVFISPADVSVKESGSSLSV
jgi:Ion channel